MRGSPPPVGPGSSPGDACSARFVILKPIKIPAWRFFLLGLRQPGTRGTTSACLIVAATHRYRRCRSLIRARCRKPMVTRPAGCR